MVFKIGDWRSIWSPQGSNSRTNEGMNKAQEKKFRDPRDISKEVRFARR